MRQRKHAIRQRKGRACTGRKARRADLDLLRHDPRAKRDVIIGKRLALMQRHAEAGVRPVGKGQRAVARVRDQKALPQRASRQLVAHAEGIGKGIRGGKGLLLCKDKGQRRVRLLLKGKARAAHEAVQPHLVALASVGIPSLGQSAANGKEDRRPLIPIGGVALPEIFRAVGRAPQALQLGASIGYRNGKELVLDRVLHTHLPYRWFLSYSTTLFSIVKTQAPRKKEKIKRQKPLQSALACAIMKQISFP